MQSEKNTYIDESASCISMVQPQDIVQPNTDDLSEDEYIEVKASQVKKEKSIMDKMKSKFQKMMAWSTKL